MLRHVASWGDRLPHASIWAEALKAVNPRVRALQEVLQLPIVRAFVAVAEVVSVAAPGAAVTPVTAATATPITAHAVAAAAPVLLLQVVDDPERDLRAGSGVDIGGAGKVEDEAAIAQMERWRYVHPWMVHAWGHLSFHAPGIVRLKRSGFLRRCRLGDRWHRHLARPGCLAR